MIENDYAVKVAKYPPNLGPDYPEDEIGPGAKMLRGPGQKSSDPFQFVAVTKGGDEMAESAKNTLQMAQQQKMQREKMLQGQRQMQKFDDDSEPWQANLDTWRKKRKEKFGDRAASENTVVTPKKNDEYSSYQPRKTKEEILEVNSAARPALPRQHSASTVSPLQSSSDELNNDSGIDNRTVGSPSTSEFSPRSTDLFVSPKSIIDEEPPHHPPPPPPVEEKLDQVLIPLKLSRSQDYAPIYRSLEKDTYYDQCPSESDKDEEVNQSSRTKNFVESSRLVERNQYMPVTNARVEATFKQPPPREGVKPFVSRAAQELNDIESRTENIDLTVELNREQKATVTATKYPRSDFIMEDHHRPQAQTHAPPPMKSSSTTRIYHAVDIPFDESPATYYPKQNNDYPRQRRYSASSISKQDGMFTLNVVMGSQPVHKGMGFTTYKRENRVIVESVIVGSPADKAGLLVGDTILSINGEDMSDKYQSGVTRILHEAARVGEADVLILRAPAPAPMLTKQLSTSSSNSSNFDKARSVFTENKSFDSYAEFKRKHTRASCDSNSSSATRSSRDFNSLPRGATAQSSLDRKRDTSLSSYRTAKDNFDSNRSSARSEYGDYRVTSYQEKNSPGRLTDFVPEVDRRLSRREQSEEIYSKTHREEEPRTIRNYHLSNENIARTNLNFDGRRDSEEESTTTTLKRSTLPRSGGTQWKNEYSDGEEVVEKLPVTSRDPSPLRSALKKSSHNYYHQETDPAPRPPPPRRFYSTESLQTPNQKSSSYQRYSEEEDEEIEENYSSMRRHRQQQPRHFDEFHSVGSYGVFPQRSRSQQPTSRLPRYDDVPDDVDLDDVSGVTHRFYDRSGNHVRAPRERTYDIQIQRDYGGRGSTPRDLDFVRNTYKWEEQQEDTKVTTTTKIYEKESRDWRDVINQQRQPAPGNSVDRRGIAATSASLSNLPNYINRRMEKEREREREYLRDREYSMPPVDPPIITEKYERDEYSRVEERTYPVPVARNNMRREETQMSQSQSQSHSQSQSQSQSQREDAVVAVSGKHRCAHCNEELGRGAAMIVESLNLFYHLACFKCYVCKTSLGSGATGADVRVRDGRLHCQTCYSNDRVQLSKV